MLLERACPVARASFHDARSALYVLVYEGSSRIFSCASLRAGRTSGSVPWARRRRRRRRDGRGENSDDAVTRSTSAWGRSDEEEGEERILDAPVHVLDVLGRDVVLEERRKLAAEPLLVFPERLELGGPNGREGQQR